MGYGDYSWGLYRDYGDTFPHSLLSTRERNTMAMVTRKHLSVSLSRPLHTYVYVSMCISVYIYSNRICTHVYIHIYIIHMCMYVCMLDIYIYIYLHTLLCIPEYT